MTPQEQIDAIIPQVQKLNRRKDSVYEEMMDSLKEHNIHLVNFQKISKKESEYLRAYFQSRNRAIDLSYDHREETAISFFKE